uniref:cGMP-dependent protein kinase interacting domain-containing protein n=1 Tax=Oryzias latipes TaxID=8090 RepID=A0A3P9HLH0_ORYLA
MSSYYQRSRDLTRTRKSVTDSPPSSPSYTDKNYRHDRLSRYNSSGEGAAEKALGRTGSYTRRETRLASLNRQEQDFTAKDYKKMYADALEENERLKSKLQDSKQELVKIRSQLERLTQRHDRISERSPLLESEKREKQALEKRVSDMEEEIKVSSYTNKLSVWFPLRNNGCIVYLTDVCFSEHSGGTRLSVALQVQAHTYRQFYCQVGLKSKGEKLVTLCCQATSCQAEEEPLLLLPCSIYPSVGVNIVT